MQHPLLIVQDLVKYFPATGGGLVHAVDGVSFELAAGETLGLVGESGCGKSTLGKTLMHLHPPTSGSVRLQGRELAAVSRRAMKPLRRDLQMVFQDPFASLNPRTTVGRAIEEPLIVHGIGNSAERRERVGAQPRDLAGQERDGESERCRDHQKRRGQEPPRAPEPEGLEVHVAPRAPLRQ